MIFEGAKRQVAATERCLQIAAWFKNAVRPSRLQIY